MKLTRSLLLSCVALLWSGYGFSIFDVEALYGVRSGQFKQSDSSTITLSGNEIKAAVHLDPIPLTPIAFGVSMSSVDYPKDTTDFQFTSFKGSEIAAEIMLWLPNPSSFKPYVKAGYTLLGAYSLSPINGLLGVDTKVLFKASGADLTIGVKWSPLYLFSFLLEGNMRSQKLTLDSVKVGGVSQDITGLNLDNKTESVLVGVEVGL